MSPTRGVYGKTKAPLQQRWQEEERPNQSLTVWDTNVLKGSLKLGTTAIQDSTFEHCFSNNQIRTRSRRGMTPRPETLSSHCTETPAAFLPSVVHLHNGLSFENKNNAVKFGHYIP
ncbi:hypothetical protein XENORESO_005107 [Xenotaenia resolanae]|uniref:Uncharacterized protein n=1 Tax=Xenotaenia resolanae TaxID=208358 RepID=A0ABV0VRQ8_9TELE